MSTPTLAAPATPPVDPVKAYLAFRAKMPLIDRQRSDYALQAGLPLVGDLVKQGLDPEIRKMMIVGGIASEMFDAAVDAAVRRAILTLVPTP